VTKPTYLALGPQFSPRSIARALWKQKVWILTFWILGSAATIAIVFQLQAVYEAEALILVESQRIPETFVASTIQPGLEARLDRLKQQVLSEERLWQLIEELNLYPKERQVKTRKEVTALMRDNINIPLEKRWSASRPGAFRVFYEAPSATIAAEVTNRIARFFIDENLKEREQEAMATSEFLESQLAESTRRLLDQEAKLSQFKVTYNTELPEQQAALLATLGQDRTELQGVQEALARTQQNKLILENTLAGAEDNLKRLQLLASQRTNPRTAAEAAIFAPAFPAAPSAPSALERARADLEAARLRYEDRHPEVRRLRRELERLVAEAERLGAEEATHVAAEQEARPAATAAPAAAPPGEDPANVLREQGLFAEKQRVEALKGQIDATSTELRNLEKRRERILQDVAAVQRRIQSIPIREQQVAAITRDYETSKANYRSLLDKKLAADVAANMEQWQKAERFVMLDAARVPEKPVRPRRRLLSAAGTILSLAGAVLLGLLLELRKNKFLGEWELPPNTAVLGRVPKLKMQGA
jgi:uncharacterized protein involved in exopolysaccharide biosynthesis